ncbi:MAG: sigma-70 family RNA polymerase sigma factor [Flavobacteriales bacterium]|jgi:RNA polymerase sigma factor (sigma-70 family)|nr:sigma-70 family RNA polymerase sigma factor [Flavobacteriales bacterium]
MEDPGKELFEGVCRGDKAAFAELYDRYSAALFGVVLKVVRDNARAEEVLQDTFVKIWRASASYDPSKGRLFTWMLNIARNTALDVVRSAEYRNSAKVQPIETRVYRTGGDELRDQMDHIGVDKILGTLPPEQREVIDMAYYQGWTQQEIADRTGTPLGTVKSRTRAAFSQLREALKEHR